MKRAIVFFVLAACGGKVADERPAPSPLSDGPCDLAAALPRPPGGCAEGTVTIELAGGNGSHWLLDQSQSTSSSDANWLTVFSPSGAQIDLAPTGATTNRDCGPCAASGSLTTQLSTWSLPPSSQTQTWDGTFFAQATCGPESLACVTPQCAPPGRYVAKACACNEADQTPTGCQKPTCVEVPFDFPSDGLVVALLPGG